LQGDFAEISLKFFVKTQHFSKETVRLEKILQFQMQFDAKAGGFGGWTFLKLKYMTRAFKRVTTLAGAEELERVEIG
jgi:hypothetical protein